MSSIAAPVRPDPNDVLVHCRVTCSPWLFTWLVCKVKRRRVLNSLPDSMVGSEFPEAMLEKLLVDATGTNFIAQRQADIQNLRRVDHRLAVLYDVPSSISSVEYE
jgi:hypothetical protein